MKGPPATHGGLALLQLRAPFAEDKVTGWLDIFVGPSPRIPAGLGVFLRTNHHHQVPIKSSDSGPAKQEAEASDPLALVDIMAARFDQSIASAQKIFGEVIGQPT